MQVINEQNRTNRSICESIMENSAPPNIPYPKRIFFIIGNEFCERFNYYGLNTILVLYLKFKLDYTENDATVLFHGFVMLTYAMCLFGGIISDVYLGKFKTILYLSVVYAIGCVIISISSIETFNISRTISLFVGLVLVSVGSGGIKPCVAAFGGDQFKLPEQAAQMDSFFSMFYFTINVGALLTVTITPIFREDVHCFGQNDCFPLAFGVPAILMLIAILLFLAGSSSYTYVKTSSENMLVQVTKCITNAISMKIRDGRRNSRKHLLDYSIDKYGEELVNDTRSLVRILVLYLPLPVFWALFMQQGSRWTFQAVKMNGDIGFYTIKPDQFGLIGPLLIIFFIPLFETIVYPMLYKIGIRRPLQKIILGGSLTALSIFISAMIQFKIESSPEKSLSMLWLAPQYIVMTLGEVMFSITGLSFSYEQAPQRMKSVIMAFWQLTASFGNLLLLFIAKLAFFDSQAHEFLLFFGLTLVDILIFMTLAYKYKSNTHAEVDSKQLQKLDYLTPLKTFDNNSSDF